MRFLRSVAFAVLSVALLQGPVVGQSTSNSPLLQAVQPFQSYDGGDLDSVNLATGMLSLHIPIVSFPQRGAMHLDYSVGYANPGTTPVIASTPAGAVGHYAISSAGIAFTNNVFPIADYTAGTLPCAECTTYTLALIDGTGTSHPLEFINAGTQARTTDGSGYFVDSPLTQTCTITDRHGVRTVWGGTLITATDPNGNQMTETPASTTGCFSTQSGSTYYSSAGAITDTMGRQIPAVPGILSPSGTWTVPGPNGGTSTYQFTSSGSTSSIILPDHRAFTFNFITVNLPLLARQTTAQTVTLLQRITLPNGGTISYGYGTPTGVGTVSSAAPMMSRTVDANDGTGPHTWTYQYSSSYNSSTQTNTLTTTVTDPVGNMSIHTFLNGSLFESEVQEKDPAGNLLKTTIKSYGVLPINDGGGPQNINGNPASITTIWPNGQQSTVSMTYDVDNNSGFVAGSYSVGPGQSGIVPNPRSGPSNYTFNYTLNPWSMSETDYGNGGSGPVLRTTTTNYLAFSNSAYFANNLLDLPQSVQVVDGGGNQRSYTIFGYDEGSLQSSGVTEQKVAGEPNAGNQTSVDRWLSNGSAVSQPSCNVSVTSGGYLVTNSTYFDTGEVQAETDPCLHSTSYLYSSSYFGAYPTTVTNSLGQKTTYSYDINTGSLLSTTDPNSNTTTNNYDIMGRLAGTAYPDGGSASYCYTDIGGAACTQASSPPYSVVATQAVSSSVSTVSTSTFDGLGRIMTTQLNSDPAGVSTVATTYDALGRVQSISNPYRSTSDGTYGITTYTYDALSRMTVQTQPDGSTQTHSYSGNIDTFTDEAKHSWQRTSDGLGRLTNVVEPTGASTSYAYDALNNLLTVNQTGVSGETPRVRSFGYDSLSRLLWSSSVESGNTCYGKGDGTVAGCQANGYDANGNLVAKTDARGVMTSYSYDALNRRTWETFSDGVTPSSLYVYDDENINFVGTPFTTSNVVGRLSVICTDIPGACQSQTAYSYDTMGRVIQAVTQTPSSGPAKVQYTTSAKYDLAGNMTDLTYPSGRHVQQTWDSAGRMASSTLADVGGVAPSTPMNYLSAAIYNPDGSPSTLSLNGVLQETIGENNRLQVQSLAVAGTSTPLTGTYLSHTYCYSSCATGGTANNGNILGITDNLSASRTQGFTYDGLNRISSFLLGGTLNQQYQIDSFGNMSLMSGGQPVYSFNSANRPNIPCGNVVAGYDFAGDQLCFTDENGAINQVTYDAANRVSSMNVLNSQAAPYASYLYDADGNRIQKSNPTGTYTEYLSFGGQTVAERDQNGNWTDYIYANGQKISKVDSSSFALHVHGNNCSTCNPSWADTTFSSPIIGYAIQSGDKLVLMQRQVNITGGIQLNTSEGGSTWPSSVDQNGHIANDETSVSDGRWHQRIIDLSSFVGQHVSNVRSTLSVTPPLDVMWDTYLRDVVIVSTDGSVHAVYTAGMQPSFSQFQPGTIANLSADANSFASDPSDPLAGTHFYGHDHLGSTHLELSAGGWPVWSGQFAPFGQELDSGSTLIHYKFTGKERDSESGLDYFGARYYASSMGRFMSPDLVNVTEDRMMNPSSTLNKYAYGANSPQKYIDPDGQDITIFYEKGVPGHIIMMAYDPNMSSAVVRSFGPASNYSKGTLGSVATILGAPVPATTKFDFNQLKSADAIRAKYASITIKTSPEVTQQVVQALVSHSGDKKYTVYGYACASSCARILNKIKQFSGLCCSNALVPVAFFNNVYEKYGNGKAGVNFLGDVTFKPGVNYGSYQPAYDPLQILSNAINYTPQIPTRNCRIDISENGISGDC